MPAPASTPTVAIACQGGGSQTAFSAGVLGTVLTDPGFGRDYRVVALSGTSGGAVCCLLAWYGLLAGGADPAPGADAAALLEAFWADNAAHDWWDLLVANPLVVGLHRLQDAGVIAQLPLPPWVPGQVQARLRALLERRVDFGRLPALLAERPDHPTLLCGAVDVLSGEFAVFQEACPDPAWRRAAAADRPPAVGVAPVLASAAVPPTLPAVAIGAARYWDGLFAHNPPIRALLEGDPSLKPDEIWVVQIDPETREREPRTPIQVVDRRFELSSNLSLNAELHWIRQVNQWVDQGVLPRPAFKLIRTGRIQMQAALGRRLDLAAKVDRDPAYLRALMADGRSEAAAFLRARRAGDPRPWDPLFPHDYLPAEAVDEVREAPSGAQPSRLPGRASAAGTR